MPEARAQDLRRAYRADGGCARGVRRGLLGERRAGPDPSAWTRFRLRFAGRWAVGTRPAQPSARLFQYPAFVYRADAVGARCGRACAAQPAVGADGFNWSLCGRAHIRPQSTELAGGRRVVLQSNRVAARVHAWSRGSDFVARRSPTAGPVA